MEEIIAQSAPQPIAPVTTAPVVVPPVAQPAPIAQQPTPMPSYSSGSGDTSIMDTIKGLNPTEIFFGILGAATLFYAIYYFKNQRVNQLRVDAIQAKLDELVISQSDLSGKIELLNANTQQQNNAGGFI